MMRNWKLGLCFMMLPYCVPVAVAATEASGVPGVSKFATDSPAATSIAEDIKAGTATPEQYFEAADKADKADDMIAATHLYRLAAEGGHAQAQVRLGMILFESGYVKQALDFYQKAAEQGNADGMFGEGMIVMGGELGKPDFVEARRLFAQAAESGHALSLHKLADAYISGGMGLDDVVRSGPEALSWIRRAADANYVPAVEALGNAYRVGLYGLAIDVKQADELKAKADKLKGVVEVKKRKKRI